MFLLSITSKAIESMTGKAKQINQTLQTNNFKMNISMGSSELIGFVEIAIICESLISSFYV